MGHSPTKKAAELVSFLETGFNIKQRTCDNYPNLSDGGVDLQPVKSYTFPVVMGTPLTS